MPDPLVIPFSFKQVCAGYETPMAAFAHRLTKTDSPYSHLVKSVTMFNGTEPHALIILTQPIQFCSIDAADRKNAEAPKLLCEAFILTYRHRDRLPDAYQCDNIHFAKNMWKTLCEQKSLPS